MILQISTLDDVLAAHATALGSDFVPYRNHAYRVANFCVEFADGSAETVQKVAIAAAFHDLGIWTDRTFDYLRPSMALAATHLAGSGRSEWVPEVESMILEHHRISPWRDRPDWLVEAFRKADWVDVSLGVLTYGLPRSLIRSAYATWPGAGFHRGLVRKTLKRVRTHPWSPLPMMRI